MSRSDDPSETPRAMIHKRILEVAGTNPDSSLERIAGEIPAATPDLVDRVLAEYGDPASATEDALPETESMSQNGSTDASATNGQEPPHDEATPLTAKQRETLAAVSDRPTASQAEIAEVLGVTRATVSRRLNDIPGFEWSERERLAETYLGAEDAASSETTEAPAPDQAEADANATVPDADGDTGDAAVDRRVAALQTRLAAIEERLDDRSETDGPGDLDPELAHKVAHACLESDAISREEELAVMEHLMQ